MKLEDFHALATEVALLELPEEISIEIRREADGRVDLSLLGTWTDVDDPTRTARTAMLIPVFLPTTLDRLLYVVNDSAERLWIHELHERLKHRGKHIVDPHPADGSFR